MPWTRKVRSPKTAFESLRLLKTLIASTGHKTSREVHPLLFQNIKTLYNSDTVTPVSDCLPRLKKRTGATARNLGNPRSMTKTDIPKNLRWSK
jgi:hypothetical protein